jgi:putative N6-adenine-specific DNA methylase
MPPENPLSKRIKRHVIGRRHNFFVATSPGFEPVCLQELLKLKPAAGEACVTPGGVEFEGRLEDCYFANLNLRSANRILMRIHTFTSSNFRKLEKKLLDIPWELYLHAGRLPKVHVTTKHCRLRHSGAIAEKFRTTIASQLSRLESTTTRKAGGSDFTAIGGKRQGREVPPSLKNNAVEPGAKHAVWKTQSDKIMTKIASTEQNIYVRGIDDCFTVSIDSSGDLLYKRGLKKHAGKAPLRETLAAAALLLAGYDGRDPLLDPMCGSGTFSLEGALMAKRIPAGWFRDFAFMGWPSFRPKRWNYMRRQAESQFVKPDRPLIFASDTDSGACQKLESCLQKYSMSDAVQVNSRDFFDIDLRELTERAGLICINPPYGRRLGGRSESEKFFQAICNRLKQKYRGWNLVLFAPSRKLAGTIPFQTKSYPILHGGLKLALLIGKIQ